VLNKPLNIIGGNENLADRMLEGTMLGVQCWRVQCSGGYNVGGYNAGGYKVDVIFMKDLDSLPQPYYSILYSDADNQLLYRCSNGKKDWGLFTRNTTIVSTEMKALINSTIPGLGFSLANIEYHEGYWP